MSKLIVEMEMPTVCDECPMMYDGIVCAATGTEVYPNRQARILKNGRVFDPCENRLDDCPIKGVLPDEHGDLIDRDEVKTAYSKSYHMAKDAPTVDAVPVVRCRDCKWAEVDAWWTYCKLGHKEDTTNSIIYTCTHNFYCADGERRTDGK